MKLKKAEAYIDTVVTVFINLIILYLVLNLFSYMITYQKLNHAADNIIRCAAIYGTTEDAVIETDVNEYITNEGFDLSKVNVSFDGTEYMNGTTENVQFGDTILLNIKTGQSFKFIGRTGSSIFNISINKTRISEKYHQDANIVIAPMPSNPVTEIKRNGIIPDGAVYTPNGGAAITGNGTNTFPDTPADGDMYEEGDYFYFYYSSPSGWCVEVGDNSKTTYGEIVSEIAGQPITNMDYTFSDCIYFTTAPAIPSSVTNMSATFYNCTSLTTAPTIPNSVTDMYYTFDGCTSLTTAPAIPSSVTDMGGTFQDCTSLTSAPVIPSSVTNMTNTFYGCTSLTTAPAIPSSVADMFKTFCGCTSLTTAPAIPSSVTNMSYTFNGCTNLTGTIEVNSNPTYYTDCLKSTRITSITGSCSQTTKNRLMGSK